MNSYSLSDGSRFLNRHKRATQQGLEQSKTSKQNCQIDRYAFTAAKVSRWKEHNIRGSLKKVLDIRSLDFGLLVRLELPIISMKLASACKGHSIPEQFYENMTVTATLDRGAQALVATEDCEGKGVYRNTKGQLIHGDILLAVNNVALNDDQTAVKNTFAKATTAGGKITVRMLRLKRQCPMKCTLPSGFKEEENYEYEWVMLYLIKGLRLSLARKEIEGKLFVAQLLPDGIACMGLSVGERIVDIDGHIVNDMKTAVDKMRDLIEKNGMIRICVESPTDDGLKNKTRMNIQKVLASEEPSDNPPEEETQAFAEKGVKAIKVIKGEPKSILKEYTTKSTAAPTKKTTFNEKTTELGILIEIQNKLLVTVPPAKTVESEAAMAPPK